jgi:hypothetical protein
MLILLLGAGTVWNQPEPWNVEGRRICVQANRKVPFLRQPKESKSECVHLYVCVVHVEKLDSSYVT